MSKIIKRNISDACEEYIKRFGANKNLYRVIPSMIDGLKPVSRRIMYAMYIKGHKPRSNRTKVATIVGDTMHFHPHGDASITDVIIGMGQSFNNNAMLIDPKGNYGSLAGDEAAAARYINARLSEYAWKCFFEDYKDSNVDTKETYTGETTEPEFLPARYPHALINGTLGIGYALASNIPPYNVKEVFDATIKLIKNPDAKIYILPDSPTGSTIVDDGQFEKVCETGSGSYRMRGNVKVDEVNNIISILDVPYQTNLFDILKKIVAMKKDFPEMLRISNQSNKENGIKCHIYLKSDANPYDFVEKLYKKKTGLEESYPINIKLIDDYADYDFSIKGFLTEWIEYRRDIKRSSYNNILVRLMEQKHINDIMLFIMNEDNAEKTVNIMRKSRNKAESIERLVKTYDITSLQAASIYGMGMGAFNIDAYESYKAKKAMLDEQIKRNEEILDNDDLIDDIIIEELKEGIKLFGVPRKSPVINLAKKKDIPDTNHIVAISVDGHCKKLAEGVTNVGRVGKNNEQFVAMMLNNRDNILVFDKTGRVSKVSISTIPIVENEDTGVSLKRYFTIENDIVMMLKEPNEMTNDKDMFITFITKNGYVKKTPLSEFKKIKDFKMGIKLDEGDELVSVAAVSGDTSKDMIIFTNKGNGIRIDINEIKSYGRQARGLKHVTLGEDEHVIGSNKIEPSKKFLLYITQQGKVKMTETKYFPKMKRKDETLSLITLDEGDELVGIISVRNDQEVVVNKKYAQPQVIDTSQIEVSTRVAKAKKIITLPKGDYVVSYKALN